MRASCIALLLTGNVGKPGTGANIFRGHDNVQGTTDVGPDIVKGIVKQFPLILSSGRLVEYEGGVEETRSNKWLAELQQDMFIEFSPADAGDCGIRDGGWVWITGAENGSRAKVKALVTERVGKGVAWMPFHFGGWFGGEDLRSKYPEGTDPVVLGESANSITTCGYDPATGMQEPKVTLCQIVSA